MKKEEIIEGNKLIAEFMELQSSKVANGLSDIKYKHNFTQHGFYEETNEGMLLFHSSWDWLMPVVEKIEKTPYPLNPGYFMRIDIHSTHTTIRVTIGNEVVFHIYGLGESKLETTWNAVAKFIKWYNKQEK